MKRTIFNVIDRLSFQSNKFYDFFMKSKDWTLEQLEDYQLKKLREISKIWDLGIRSWEDFYGLPFMSKEDLPSKPLRPVDCHTHETSGSTGEPCRIFVPKETWIRKMSVFRRSWTLMGRKNEPILRLIAGKGKFGWYDYWRNVKALTYRKIGSEHISYLVNEKPFLIHGLGGSTRILVEACAMLGYHDLLKEIKIMFLGQSAEGHRERLTELCKSFHENYGLAELPTVANACEHNMHLVMETGICEIVKGEIVVTDFNNNAIPIIRYKTKDHGKIRESDCPCGMQHPIMYDVKGRRTDYYFGPEVKRPIGWWIVSPILHRYLDSIKKWRADVYPKKGKMRLYVIFRGEPDFERLEWYQRWVKDQIGLDCEIMARNSESQRWKWRLVRVIT